MKNNEMGRVCGTYRGRGEVHVTVGWENLTNSHLEDLGIDGSIILECILNGWEGLDWINVT
jgi:hypothetical protein